MNKTGLRELTIRGLTTPGLTTSGLTTPGLTTPGLTTGEAPFIEDVEERGQVFIHQPYELYSGENHEVWGKLYARMQSRWDRYANERFLSGIASLNLNPRRVPRLEEVNTFLGPLTGFKAEAVAGYIPAFTFFHCLRNRTFPTTITIRRADKLDYLPEPDIFHDIAGHVPMHTDRRFADTLARFGDCAYTAAEMASTIHQSDERVRVLTSVVRAMARFFWFTIEFGLMRGPDCTIRDRGIGDGGIRAYGSGLLSSFGEIEHGIESPRVERCPLRLERVIQQEFQIDRYQPLLFVIESFDHLYSLVDRFERWMKQGKLDNVAPGAPEIREADIASFLHAPTQL